jgi:uncharacterized protein involved in response to NO
MGSGVFDCSGTALCWQLTRWYKTRILKGAAVKRQHFSNSTYPTGLLQHQSKAKCRRH